jgi:hypothetical protein
MMSPMLELIAPAIFQFHPSFLGEFRD